MKRSFCYSVHSQLLIEQVFFFIKKKIKMDLLYSIKHFFKTNSLYIDNKIFRLHYKVTFIVLVTFSLLVTANQYIGDPIDCITEEIPQKLMDSYCWTHSTYTVQNEKINGVVGRDFIYPGVLNHANSQVKYHKYYQWIWLFLFLQAVLFYTPHYLWKSWEGNRIKMLVGNLNESVLINEYKIEQKNIIINYLKENRQQHNFYAFRFFICEVLNFINIFVQIFFVNFFLGNEFTTYGIDVLKFSELDTELRFDPMSRIFPKVTKCSFSTYGPSGSVQNFDALCILPVNIVNEKIYIVLWFWFSFLVMLSAFGLIYRLIVILVPKLRYFLLCSQTKLSPRNKIQNILNMCRIGDWFLLYQLSRNINSLIFSEIICELEAQLVLRRINIRSLEYY